MRFPGFVGSAYTPQSPNVDIQRLVNWYVEVVENPDGKVPKSLLPAPGFTTFATLPKSPVRGLLAVSDRFFAVGGDAFYEVDRAGNITTWPMTTLTDPTTPAITNSPFPTALSAPSKPQVTHGGTFGTTKYGYKVTATNDLGETDASLEGTSDYGFTPLSATNFNVVTWTAVEGATGYKVYRTTGGSSTPPVLLGTTTNLSYRDIGEAGSSQNPPTNNTTGGNIGATTYGYKIVAKLGLATTAASPEGLTTTGQAVLSASNFNIIRWATVINAAGYDIYRTTGTVSGKAPPRLIGSVDADTLTFNDTGQAGTATTPPSTNTTGTFVIDNDGYPVSMSSSGDTGHEVFIVAAGSGYVFNLQTGTLTKVLTGATSGVYIGNYFVALNAATNSFRVSDLLDGLTWDDTQVYERSLAPDRWIAMAVQNGQLWLLGTATSEVWVLTGQDATRFAPYTPAFIQTGIMAAQSLAPVGGSLMWVSQDGDGGGVVVRTQGYSPGRVSTHAIETAIQNYITQFEAFAWTYQQEGHTFYVLVFPTDNGTWVYDLTTGLWHERLYWDSTNNVYKAYRPQCHALAFGGLGSGTHLVGDRLSGVIAKMGVTYGTDIDAAAIRRVRRCPHLSKDGLKVFHVRVQVDLEVGLGVETGQGSDPTMMLHWSDDAGKTYGNEHWRSAGARGTYKTRVFWSQLGSAYDRVYEFVVTDPIPWRVAQAFIDVRGGR